MKQVDNYFKEALANHESQVSSEIWKGVNSSLDEKDKVRPYIYILLLSALVIVGSIGVITGSKKIFSTTEQLAIGSSKKEIIKCSPLASNITARHTPKLTQTTRLVKIKSTPTQKELNLVVTNSYYDKVETTKTIFTTLPLSKRTKRLVKPLPTLEQPTTLVKSGRNYFYNFQIYRP